MIKNDSKTGYINWAAISNETLRCLNTEKDQLLRVFLDSSDFAWSIDFITFLDPFKGKQSK